ncbi:MAG: helix-turn-helix domain-containing protein [Rhodospirillales bacterium]|nr:helix-turn-helix domain-containing protein [Rhodospirillales bacterium]
MTKRVASRRGGPADPIDSRVGTRIRVRRQCLGWSQTKLAGQIRISFQQLQKYENGTNRVSAGRLARIADALDIDVGWFFRDDAVPPALEGNDAKSKELSRLTAIFMRLSKPARQKLRLIATALSGP